MAAELTRRISLEYPDFTIHDVVATNLYYNEDKDSYIMTYYDLTLDNNMYTVLSRVNGRLVKNPFMEEEQINNLALNVKPAELSVLSDNIRCLKVPLNQTRTQSVARFDVFNGPDGYYIRRNTANRFGIIGNGTFTYNGEDLVRVDHQEIERVIRLTRNDSVVLEPVYHPMALQQRVALFRVLDDGEGLYILRELAQQFGMDHGLAFLREGFEWTRVTMAEVREIEERTKNNPIALKAKFEKIERLYRDHYRNGNGNNPNNPYVNGGGNPDDKNTQAIALFRVLDDGEGLYIIRELARQYKVDHGFAFYKDELEWTRVTKEDIHRIETESRAGLLPLKASYERIAKVKRNLNPKAFTVVIDVLIDDKELFVRKEVAERFGIVGNVMTYESYKWVKVDEELLAKIKHSYQDRNALVEFKYIQKKNTNKLRDDEFEVLVDGENQYVSIDIVNRFNIDNLGVINVNGKHYCKVSDKEIKKIIAATFYSNNSLTPKYVRLTKHSKKEETRTDSRALDLYYTVIDNKKFVPANLPVNMELDLMNGRKIRIDGEIYISVSNQRFQEIFNELMMMGYKVTLTYKEVEKVVKTNDDNKKITK